ncbi:VOC family protein [Nocardia arthritidis]|uniref:VOC domain-containing protein n=1 Tax=Nocardia arthritidis TaxID=228602 RepID=A0A6G9YAI9_9NOCA|nr:VOC family protein [Nocardia arthritidis]QIS10097.1 hypothetical protein F5544_11010 [Nocardia arthritidis]
MTGERFATRRWRWIAVTAVLAAAAIIAALVAPGHRSAGPDAATGPAVTLIDITSADVPRDRAFYEHSFGWTLKADYPNYPILSAGNGPDIGIAMLGNPEAGKLEPLYRIGKSIVFFGVPDIKATLTRAESLGGKVVQPETAVSVGGSYAMFTDPVGNTIALTRSAPGATNPAIAVGKPNPATLVAISTPDVPGTRRFYEQLFGLRLKEQSPGYPILTSGTGPDIGIALADDPAAGPARPLYQVGQPVVLLQTPDIEATLHDIAASGGKTFQPKTSLASGGAYAFFTDPSGNSLGLLERP